MSIEKPYILSLEELKKAEEVTAKKSHEKTPEEIKELENRRKQYEKTVNKDSDSALKSFIWEILLSKGSVSAKDIMFSDAKHEDDLRNHGSYIDLDNTSESTLTLKPLPNPDNAGKFEYKPTGTTKGRYGSDCIVTGYIKGKKIIIKDDYSFGISGTIDGQKISKEDAIKIFDKYFSVAKERTERIEALKIKSQEKNNNQTVQKKVDDILK